MASIEGGMDEGYEDSSRNDGVELDVQTLNEAEFNTPAAVRSMREHGYWRCPGPHWEAGWTLRAVAVCEHPEQTEVRRTCNDASAPVSGLPGRLDQTSCASVRVKSSVVAECRSLLKKATTRVTCLARMSNLVDEPVRIRLGYVADAAGLGAEEIEVEASRALCRVLDWVELYEELTALKEAADKSQLVVLLPVETLGSLQNLYRAAMVAMMAGANFVAPVEYPKLTAAIPSDGPHPAMGGTPFECGLAVLRAIRDYRDLSGFTVGFKVHDCKCTHDALLWIMLLKQELGVEWIVPALLRIGGEDLLPDMQRSLHSISSGADTYKR